MKKIRDRIKDFRRVKASELKANPRNWRTHPSEQRSAFRGLLREAGIAGAVIAYESESGLHLIDGHMRLEEIGESSDVPVLILDVTEEEAEKLLAAIDPIAGMATTDEGKLQSLLADIEAQDNDFAELLASLAVEESEAKLVKLETQPPPKMAWALIGIPTVRYGEIASSIETIAKIDGVRIETVVNNG